MHMSLWLRGLVRPNIGLLGITLAPNREIANLRDFAQLISISVVSMSVEGLPKIMFPPSPPLTDKAESDTSSLNDEEFGGGIPLPPESVNPTEILAIDAASPDKHVPRDPRLIRLTGNHPFNCEAPLTELFNAGMAQLRTRKLTKGFLTPPELHYVRNHGAVPQVLDDEILGWKVSIEGYISL